MEAPLTAAGHAVVSGAYADFKIIKTRSVFQAIIECPIEEAEAFINAFGIPISGQERHVAVALIQPPAPVPVPRETRVEQDSGAPKVEHPNHPKNTAASERFRALGKPEQMVAKAGMLCSQPLFRQWAEAVAGHHIVDVANWVRHQLKIESRNELASNPDAQRIWEQMVTGYDVWRGALPEIR